MAAPLALGRGLRNDKFVVAWWLALAAMTAALVVSTSRSGGLGALAGCLTLLVLAFRRRLWIAVSAAASGVLLSAALWAIVFGPLSLLNNDPARSRLLLWADAVRMIASRPLTGWGEDATGLVFGRFLTGNWSPGVTFDRIHSGPLDLVATQGVLGLGTTALILVILFRGAWRSRRSHDVAALTAACAAYTVWVLFNFDWAPATGAFWLLAGSAWSAIRAGESGSPGSYVSGAPATPGLAFWRTGVAIALALLAIGLGVFPVLADAWYWRGRTELSVLVDPLQARYHWLFGQSLAAEGSVERGVDEMKRAADLGETEPQLYVDLGDREAQLGRTADARRHYQRALEIDPYYAPAIRRLAVTS
jgi:hypothetical protein